MKISYHSYIAFGNIKIIFIGKVYFLTSFFIGKVYFFNAKNIGKVYNWSQEGECNYVKS